MLALGKMPGRVTLRKKQGLWIMAHEGTSFLLHLVMSSPVGFNGTTLFTGKKLRTRIAKSDYMLVGLGMPSAMVSLNGSESVG